MTEKVVWHVVREFAAKAAIDKLAPHDLRRTCARLCHAEGVIFWAMLLLWNAHNRAL